IRWRGFPLLLRERHDGDLEESYKEADQLPPYPAGGERPQDEYLEWFVTRSAGKITRVTFTCEGPEYWQALAHGYPSRYNGPRTAGATGSLAKALDLYQRFV